MSDSGVPKGDLLHPTTVAKTPRRRRTRTRRKPLDESPAMTTTKVSSGSRGEDAAATEAEVELIGYMAEINELRTTLRGLAYSLTDSTLAGHLFNIRAEADVAKLQKDREFDRIFKMCAEYTSDVSGIILGALLLGKSNNRNSAPGVLEIIRNATKQLLPADDISCTDVGVWIKSVEECSACVRTPTRCLRTLRDMLSLFCKVCETSPGCYNALASAIGRLERTKIASPKEVRFKRTICIYHMSSGGCKYGEKACECNYAHGYADICWPSPATE